MLTAQTLRGVWATVLLDIDENGAPHLDCIGEQIAAFAAAGVDGIYCNGTATEFHCQDDATCHAVMKHTIDSARPIGLPVQLGASHPLAPGSLERIAMAAAMKPDAIQITLPDWAPVDLDAALAFLGRCAETADGCPLVLYNPPHAKTVLLPDQFTYLADAVASLIGLKCGGGDADWYAAMRPVFARWSVFIPGHHYASGVSQGAHGSYSNMACLNPKAAIDWARQCDNDPEGAFDLERRIADFMADAIAPMIASGRPGYACDKAMAVAGGWARISPRLMWPYRGAEPREVERIVHAARDHIPEFTGAMRLA